jgi:kynurenine formamidase
MDAPFHFFGEGHPIDRVPLEQCVGPAVLIRLPHHGAGTQITKEDLMGYCDALCETRKVVLNTGWYRRWGDHAFFVEHPVIAGEAAEFLVECGVHLVGVDMPSVDRYPFDAHVALLGHGAVIVENLTNLDAIGGERFYLVALPLKIIGRDGSPVRAIAMGV